MHDEDERPEWDFATAPAYPTTVAIAGIAWIIFGGINLLLMLLLFMFSAAAGGQAGAAGGQAGAAVAGGACAGLVLGLFGAAFIFVGIQSVQGTARDTLGNGIGSIVFGFINFGSAAAQAAGGQVIPAGIGFLAGVGLLAAGILALVGRSDYKTWRKAQKAKRKR
jgi:hypothetical protein